MDGSLVERWKRSEGIQGFRAASLADQVLECVTGGGG